MIDIILLAGRLLLVALLYVFLFAILKTGIGQVKGASAKGKNWHLSIEKGPKELRGVDIIVTDPVIVGRSPNADIVIAASYVSGRHAQFQLMGENLFVEDLNSKNGTAVNNDYIYEPIAVHDRDAITVGDVVIRARYR